MMMAPTPPRICARAPGVDPAEFWDRAPGAARWQAMAAKYLALAELARMPDGPERARRLRYIAARWPGSLREAELIGPARVDERGTATNAGLAAPDQPRRAWIDDPAAVAVILWAELHRLLGDQLRFRRRAPSDAGEPARDTEAFARWLVGGAAEGRWPGLDRLPELIGAKLRVRGAYLALAARAGLALPELNQLLLARAGHWDVRPDDPAWAHAV